jgi:hypothetical protein
MASFTDAIPSFNPYIQQLPIESMVSVGMEKQKRYDEGVQKIQGQIDQVAGLDIVRDVDRQYLQSKLNDLGSKLKTVAASDFSNFQLVNSVGGMASKIAKDNTVMNSVQSTAKFRKEQSMMEEARQKGESAIQNEYDFSVQTDKWLNDTNVGQSYNGRYRKYIDVDKKWFDVLKSLHSDLAEEDIPYVRNEDGSLNRQQTAEAMQRISKESVSSNKIENALRASLSPDELEQLNINGRYEFRGIQDPVQFGVYATAKGNSQIQQNEKYIKELKGVIALSSSDQNKKLQAEEGIKALEDANRNIKTQINNELEMINTDLESAKGYLYRKGAIEQFASAHAWEKQKSNLLTNPINSYRLDLANHQLSVARFQQSQEEFNWKKVIDSEKLKLDQFESSMKNNGMMSPDSSIYGGVSTKINNQRGELLKEINQNNESYESTIRTVLNSLGPDVSRDQLENAIKLYNEGDANEFDKIIPVQFKAVINQAIKSKKEARTLALYEEQVFQKVKTSSPLVAEHNAKLNELAQDIKPITVDGVEFSSEEVRRYLDKITKSDKTESSPVGGITVRSEFLPTRALTQKEELLRGNQRILLQNNSYLRTVNNFEDVLNEAVEKQMAEDNGKFLPVLNNILLPNTEGGAARNKMENLTSGFLQKYSGDFLSGMKGGSESLSEDDIEKAFGWLGESDRNVLLYGLINQNNSNYLSVRKGAEEVIIPIDEREVRMLPLGTDIKQSSAYKDLISTQALFNGETNPTGNFSDSKFDRIDMPNVTYNVRADLTQEFNNPDRQYLTLRLMTPQGPIPYQYPESLDASGAINFISRLNNQEVKELYLRSSISPELKKLIENL